MAGRRRRALSVCLAVLAIYLLYQSLHGRKPVFSAVDLRGSSTRRTSKDGAVHFIWKNIPQRHPVTSFAPIPTNRVPIPKIQAAHFEVRDEAAARLQFERLAAVKSNFTHAWKGYRKYAWLKDELTPVSRSSKATFGGWGATLVDSLGTLWIMGMYDEFDEAIKALDKIDFTTCTLQELNVFETNIRYLGGLLSAYDLSEGRYPELLTKAEELGEILYHAFDTPNRMPITRWNYNAAGMGQRQEAKRQVLVAELGSFSLEFTRLSQLTGNPKYYDAVKRVMDVFDRQQNETNVPGLWPVLVNAYSMNFASGTAFTIGGMADSTYEYLPKQHLLLGGATSQYQRMYEFALEAMKEHIFYRPSTPENKAILLPGKFTAFAALGKLEDMSTEAEGQHLACFAGGMVGLGSRLFNKTEDMETARQLVEGCLWAYEGGLHGIMPEVFETTSCPRHERCVWNETQWHEELLAAHPGYMDVDALLKIKQFPPGMTKVTDARYILRPEAIESVFYLYRMTGDSTLQDRAWKMFENIIRVTKTKIAHSAISDVTVSHPPKMDSMESFWLSEALKYFYLIFAFPEFISLDDFVFNTEAHPLKLIKN